MKPLLLSTFLTLASICTGQGEQSNPFDEPLTEDNANLNALQAYQQTFVCTEFSDQYWRDVVEQCKSVCVMGRADGETANSEEDRWVEGSYSCLGESEWLSFRTGEPSDDPSESEDVS